MAVITPSMALQSPNVWYTPLPASGIALTSSQERSDIIGSLNHWINGVTFVNLERDAGTFGWCHHVVDNAGNVYDADGVTIVAPNVPRKVGSGGLSQCNSQQANGQGWPLASWMLGDDGEKHLTLWNKDTGEYVEWIGFAHSGGSFTYWWGGHVLNTRQNKGIQAGHLKGDQSDNMGTTSLGGMNALGVVMDYEMRAAIANYNAGDFVNAKIPHALGFKVWQRHPNRWKYPAGRTDDTGTPSPPKVTYGVGGDAHRLGHTPASNLQIGQIVAFNQDVDPQTINFPGLNSYDMMCARIFYRTMQMHGGIPCDQSGKSFSYIGEQRRGPSGARSHVSYGTGAGGNLAKNWITALWNYALSNNKVRCVETGRNVETDLGQAEPANSATIYRAFGGAAPPPPPPSTGAPRNLAIDNTTATLSWQAPTSGTVTGYRVYRNSVSVAGNLSATTLTWQDLSPVNGASYVVVAVSGQVESSPSNSVIYTAPAGPPPAQQTSFFDDHSDGDPNTGGKWPDSSGGPHIEAGGSLQIVPTTAFPSASSIGDLSIEDPPGQVTFLIESFPNPGTNSLIEARCRLWKPSESRWYEFRWLGGSLRAGTHIIGTGPAPETILSGWTSAETRLRMRKTTAGTLVFETATPTGSFTVRHTLTPPSTLDRLQITYQTHMPAGEGDPGVFKVSSVVLEPVTGGADTTAPAAPARPVVGDMSAGTVPLTWTPNTEPDLARYVVERGDGASPGSFTRIATPTSPSFTDTTVVRGSTYTYRLRAEDTASPTNVSLPSQSATAAVPLATDVTAPPIPTGVVGVASNRKVTVTVNASSASDFARFEWERSVAGAAFEFLMESTTTQIVDTAVSNGVGYRYRARAVDTTGNRSDPSAASTSVTPAAAAMTALDNVEVLPGDGLLRVVWDAPPPDEDVSAIRIRVKLTTDGTPIDNITPQYEGLGTVLGGRRFADITGLTNGSAYNVRVKPARAQ